MIIFGIKRLQVRCLGVHITTDIDVTINATWYTLLAELLTAYQTGNQKFVSKYDYMLVMHKSQTRLWGNVSTSYTVE